MRVVDVGVLAIYVIGEAILLLILVSSYPLEIGVPERVIFQTDLEVSLDLVVLVRVIEDAVKVLKVF